MLPPDLLLTLFSVLYGCPNTEHYSAKVPPTRMPFSLLEMGVLIKTAKHMVLGLAVKSMTSSKKLLRLLYRFGHISDYHYTEELETPLGKLIQNNSRTVQKGVFLIYQWVWSSIILMNRLKHYFEKIPFIIL